jgi:hypothetical protein
MAELLGSLNRERNLIEICLFQDTNELALYFFFLKLHMCV